MDCIELRVVLIHLCLFCAGAVRAAEPPALPGWRLVFDDEFNGTAVDTTKWNLNDPWGVERNHELQAYVPDAFEIKDGILRIKAERRDANYGGKLRHVISGMMTTYQKFSQQFGRFDIRCRAPRGKGLWPAFWLLPDPLGWPPEIDVLEVLGQNTKTVYFTHHWKDAAGKLQSDHGRWPPDWKITSRGVRGPFESKDDFAAGFHEISCQWSADDIRWSIDGAERFRSTKSIPRGKMYLLLNLAVGGDWPGAPDERTPFPSALEVDWVRCYEKAPAGGK